MRSSIACARCRRSKIKCVNAGIDTTCRACESSGRECVYPVPSIGGGNGGGGGGGAKRDIGALADGNDRNPEWDAASKRQRPRKSVAMSAAARYPTKNNVDVLDSSILTIKAWETVFDLFQSHYATLLPFLHPANFLNQIRQLSSSSSSSDSSLPDGVGRRTSQDISLSTTSNRAEPSPLVLLGVLTLTARFHPQLVAFNSPPIADSPPNPIAASEFYAKALRSRLAGIDAANFALPDLTRVQAFLMLALHEWGMCRGKNAWVDLGMAIRLAHVIGLPFELENDILSRDTQRSGSVPSLKPDSMDHFGGVTKPLVERREQTSDDVIAQETKRRTFWACFILDRCLSVGKYRPRIIRVDDLNIQLPSDNAFAFGERVRTARLSEPSGRRTQRLASQGVQIPSIRQSLGFGDEKLTPNGPQDPKSWSPISGRKDSGDEDIDRWEIGVEEPVGSRVIRIIRIWGSIMKWSCAGGRRTEQYPPWHPDSQFVRLRSMLADFQDGLSRNLQYSPRNTDTHIMYRNTLASYTVMHAVYFLSVIVLHRSYLPFFPLRCSEPMGPLEEPIFAVDKITLPDGFWQESAKEMFKAARQMIDLSVTCQERGALVENCLVGFAVYNATLVGLYALHFPHMDQEGFFCPKSGLGDSNDNGNGNANVNGSSNGCQNGRTPTQKALVILRDMRLRLKTATGWFRTLNRLHSFFSKWKGEQLRRHTTAATAAAGRKVDLRSDSSTDLHTNDVRPIGNLVELKLLEKLFHDFGIAADQLSQNNGNSEKENAVVEAVPDQEVNGNVNVNANAHANASASDAGSTAVKSEPAECRDAPPPPHPHHPPPPPPPPHLPRRESWIPINGSGSSISMPDGERRPSLPIPPPPPPPPPSRPLQSSPSFTTTLPSLQHHHPDAPGPSFFSNTSPSLRSIASSSPSYASPPAPQVPPQYLPSASSPSTNTTTATAATNTATRLQPLNSWLTSPRQHQQQQQPTLPPISAPPTTTTTTSTTTQPSSTHTQPNLPMLPLPSPGSGYGSGSGYGFGFGVGAGVVSPPATTDSGENIPTTTTNTTAGNFINGNAVIGGNGGGHIPILSTICLGGDDILAFLDGSGEGEGEGDQQQQWAGVSEIGVPTGWLGMVWGDVGR